MSAYAKGKAKVLIGCENRKTRWNLTKLETRLLAVIPGNWLVNNENLKY